ncbi:hypothetical protein EX30DRAFT_338914, partial [Ascodesmis nigricans]
MSLRSLLLIASCALAATASPNWTFTAGKATLLQKGEAEGRSSSFAPGKPLEDPIALGSKDTLKLTLTLNEGEDTGRPHQAYVLVKDAGSDLETHYPLSVKSNNGKAKLDLTHKDIPAHLLDTSDLSLSLVIASFGDNTPLLAPIGSVKPVITDAEKVTLEKQKAKDVGDEERFGSKPEIRHTFRADPKNPPLVITLAFLGAVLASFVGILGVWFPFLGANLGHLPKAMGTAPIAHTVFFGSLIAVEGLFVLYYTRWNLFQTLGGVGIAGLISFLSG